MLTEQPPQLGNIKEKGAAEQMKWFLMARKKWARRQAKGVTLPTLVQLMEERDIELLSTIALARFQQEDEMTHSAEYRDRAGASNRRDEERFWISDDDDDEGAEEGGQHIKPPRNCRAPQERVCHAAGLNLI